MTTTLICRDTPGLKVGPGGPGTKHPEHVIIFEPVYAGRDASGLSRPPEYGIATIEDDDPLRAEKMGWVAQYPELGIRIIDPDADEAPSATDPGAILCPCGLPWVSPQARDSHMIRTHCQPKPYNPDE